ncbi:MAG TPA: hypothetical protein VFB12_18575 [Ktedonobacteraceae bacterium]|nr:hypothetical protein [Ktedonobacteraceae bacterium]
MKRSIFTMMILILFLFTFVGLDACGSNVGHSSQQNTPVPGETPRQAMGLNELIAQLKAAGATVVPGATLNQPFMSVEGRTLSVNGEQIQVYEYTSASDADRQAAAISPDGTSFTTISSSSVATGATQVDWIKPPHLYKAGRIIVIYVGTTGSLLHLLEGVLGKQFAGQ